MHFLLNRVEALAGALTATLIVLGAAAVVMVTTEMAGPNPFPRMVEAGIVVGLCLVFDGPFLIRLWTTACQCDTPFGPVMAASSRYGTPSRRLVGLIWWAAHFLFGMIFVLAMHGNQPKEPVRFFVMLGLAFGANVASNVYLAMLVKAATNNDAIVGRLWRHRFTIDVVTVGIAELVQDLLP